MIKWFLTDVDGCLTNGIYLTGEDGHISKAFFSRDFHGMMMLNESDVKIAMITLSRDKVVKEQCQRSAKYVTVLSGIRDKVLAAKDFYNLADTDWENVSYIGDDLIDIPILEKVGLPACPFDAHDSVTKLVSGLDNGIILRKNGGEGCVRELVDIVMEINCAN